MARGELYEQESLNKVQQLGGFPGGCTATGERRIQLLAPFNSFFDGMVTTSLQVVVVLSKVKAVQTSVYGGLVVKTPRGRRRVVDKYF